MLNARTSTTHSPGPGCGSAKSLARRRPPGAAESVVNPRMRLLRQVVGCVQDGAKEARVTLVEVIFAQRQDALGAADTGQDDPGFPQDLLMMGEGGPADRQAGVMLQATARRLALGGQGPDRGQAGGICQCGEDGGQPEVLRRGVRLAYTCVHTV